MKKEEIVKLFPIEMERLVLRLATLDDAHLIQVAKESRASDVLRRWMSWSSDEGMSMQGTINYLNMACAEDNRRNIALLGVDKVTGAHVVSTGLDAEDDDFQEVATGWWLSDGHEGKGLAFEAVRALIDVCRKNAVTKKITCSHYEGNERSGNLMRRLGFEYIGTRAKDHRCHLNGEMLDCLDYELVI